MKGPHLLVLLALLLGMFHVSAQLTDDFSDGNLTSNPEWLGEPEKFEVNLAQQLHTIETEAGQAFLYTAVSQSLDNTSWEVWVKQSFAPSGNNFSRYYLSALLPQFSFSGNSGSGAQGYFLQLGESGSEDALRLFRDDATDTAPIEIASGITGALAESFEVRIKVDRDDAGNWTMYMDPTGGTAYQFEGSGTDATYNSTNALGLTCTYTASNADNFFFDDIYFGAPISDTTPPVVEILEVVNSNTLTLTFNEPLLQSTAENVENYVVPIQLSPSAATLDTENPGFVTLEFGSTFPANTTLTLEIANVEDLWGNAIAPTSIEFIYTEGSDASFGDVIINEIFADPSPPLGLPEFEFVEIYNTTSNFYDLSNWVFVNSTTEKTLPAVILEPNGFLILCDEDASSEFTSYGNVIGIPSFTALANTADSLTLKDNNGLVLDIVVYDDSWYGDPLLDDGGVTLERINPFATCSGSSNWTASSAFSGGSPGAQNTVFNDTPDLTPPAFTSWNFSAPTILELNFNEPLENDAADNVSAQFDAPIPILSLQLNDSRTQIIATLDTPLEIGEAYILTMDGVADCEGNSWTEPIDISIFLGFQPEEGDLLITEIFPDPDNELPSPAAEFIEIYNAGTQVLDLSQLELSGGFFNTQVTIAPESYLVIADIENTIAFLIFQNVVFMEDFPGLTNSGRSLVLSQNGAVLDSLSYDLSWYHDASKDDGGYSMERVSLNDPCSDGDNWRASVDPSGATPALENSVNDPSPDTTVPEILYVLIESADELRVVFNEGLDALSGELVEAEVGFLQNGNFVGLEYNLLNAVWDASAPKELYLAFDGGFAPPLIYTLRLQGVADCWGNSAENIQGNFAVPETAQPNDLVINELLSNPRATGIDFVEIYNRSPRNISLQGWQLAKESGGQPESAKIITELPLVLLSGEYVYLSSSAEIVKSEYPGANENKGLTMPSFPSYNNDDGIALLLAPDESMMDRLVYTAEMQYPLLNSSDGVSLERVNPDLAASIETNWHSAAGTAGYATPGLRNSQFADSPTITGSIQTSPEVFSPDNDGFEDVVQIAYTFDAPGFTGSITIYDQSGRLVRRLVKQELLGGEGIYIWDGINDNRTKSGMGIYIVFLEAFDPNGNVIQLRTTSVLGHPLN